MNTAKTEFLLLGFLTLFPSALAADEAKAPAPLKIKTLALIHLSHTDYGFTEHPAVVRDIHKRYLDIALDAALATAGRKGGQFHWTAEGTVPVLDWWQSASVQRRQELLNSIALGQLEIAALPMNNSPTLDARQWDFALNWLPDTLWRQLNPRVAVQNDVNGLPRAAAMRLLDRGIRYLWMGINGDMGGSPFRAPTAFWWKMPDGRRMLVYLTMAYPVGYYFLESEPWIRSNPRAADTRFRSARPGDFLDDDEASVRRAHAHCLAQLRKLEEGGYPYEIVALSMTNQWRIDNDPPFPSLADFVAAWNRLGLQPALKLTTVLEAMSALEKAAGARLPEHSGEWTDWWANGVASGPREVAASRQAKRLLRAALSPVWGPVDAGTASKSRRLLADLCLFDEHTWGSSYSAARPDALETRGQFAEKSNLAYRPLAEAEWLLAQRARTKLANSGEGLFVVNSAPMPWSGWLEFPVEAFREKYQSARAISGVNLLIEFRPGWKPFTKPTKPEEIGPENSAGLFPDQVPGQTARIWVENLDGQETRRFELITASGPDAAKSDSQIAEVVTDGLGWPDSIRWNGMKDPLFLAGLGEFSAVGTSAFAGRWVLRDTFMTRDDAKREELRKQHLKETRAVASQPVKKEENANTIVYWQPFEHPTLLTGFRKLEVWKRSPHARLTIIVNRHPSNSPQAFFVKFPLPSHKLPVVTNGGVPFVPFKDQIPGTCRDYVSIDGVADYQTPDGQHWLWFTRDAPLISIGSPNVVARCTDTPSNPGTFYSMIYNNFWWTNFLGDAPGVLEFSFDLLWRKEVRDNSELLQLMDSVLSEPVVLLNPGYPESPLFMRYLHTP